MKINFDKLTKGVLIFSLLLVAFSFFYYYVIFLPQKEETKLKQQEEKQLLEKQERQIEQAKMCREAGEKAYNTFKKDYTGVDFFYNPRICV